VQHNESVSFLHVVQRILKYMNIKVVSVYEAISVKMEVTFSKHIVKISSLLDGVLK
jgi:hypothetical protein